MENGWFNWKIMKNNRTIISSRDASISLSNNDLSISIIVYAENHENKSKRA